jgi:hypothetical protein
VEAAINPNRRIGVEVELVLPILGLGENLDVQRLVASVLTNQGLAAVARCYSRQPVPAGHLFCVEHDTSLRDESRYTGIRWAKIELKTAPLTWDRLQVVLPPALEVVRYLGGRCNVSTGFHVHHCAAEIREQPEFARNLQHFWWAYHPVLYGLVAPSRRQTVYCRPPMRSEASLFDNASSYEHLRESLQRCDRYSGLNLTNLTDPDRLTVEWRLHGGTTSWEKVAGWILATQRWTEHCLARTVQLREQPVANSRRGLNALLIATGLKPNSRIYGKVEKELRQVGRYLLRRWRQLNPSVDLKKLVA